MIPPTQLREHSHTFYDLLQHTSIHLPRLCQLRHTLVIISALTRTFWKTILPVYKVRCCLNMLHTLTMSATLSGLIMLENARPVDGSPSSVMFDGQMWLQPGHALTGMFRHYNSSNDTFPEVGQYFAWIHVHGVLCNFAVPSAYIWQVAKFAPLDHTLQTGEDADAGPESKQHLKEWQTIEDSANNNDSTSSETLEEPDIVDVIGDIIQVCYLLLCVCKHSICPPAYSCKDRWPATTGIHKRLRRRCEHQQDWWLLQCECHSIHVLLQEQAHTFHPPCASPLQLKQV